MIQYVKHLFDRLGVCFLAIFLVSKVYFNGRRGMRSYEVNFLVSKLAVHHFLNAIGLNFI